MRGEDGAVTAGHVCLLIACIGVGELVVAARFFHQHTTEERAKSVTNAPSAANQSKRPGRARFMAMVLAASAFLSFGIAAFMWFVVAPLGVPRDRAAAAFIHSARSNDSAGIQTSSAPEASIDHAFFSAHLAGKTADIASYDLAMGGESCMEYETEDGQTFWLYLEERADRWLVVRAGPTDDRCYNQLHSD